ncbi:MAG: NAD(P)H-dependent oxidoreductase [Lachnospiraceae bacterium]|nr:NAD(P)H-dependent oxidoreductase [Lachnospiraceae bacterium]
MKELILYFSRADENYFGGSLKYIDKGNTEVVAEKAAAMTGADLFKVEPVKPYSTDYNTCIEQAKKDMQSGVRPEVVAMPENMSQYDLVTVMYPNYWGTMPMHMFTVLEQINFEGKTVRPVCTHEGSGMGRSEADLKKCCQGAVIKKGLAIQGSSVGRCDAALKKWLEA